MNLETKIKETFAQHEGDVQKGPRAWADIEHRIARNHKQRLVAAAVAGALAITGAALALPRIGNEPPRPPVLSSPTPGEPRLTAKISLPAALIAADTRSLWGLIAPTGPRGRGEVVRINPTTNEVKNRIPVGENPTALAADDDAIWVAHTDGCGPGEACLLYQTLPMGRNSVARFDPDTGKFVADVFVHHPIDVALGHGAVWVTAAGDPQDPASTLLRIDPRTNREVARIRLSGPSDSAEVAVGGGFVWVATIPQSTGGPDEITLHRVDPATNKLTSMDIVVGHPGTTDVSFGYGSVWLATAGNESANGLARIDPSTGQIQARITLADAAPIGLAAIDTGEGFVWGVGGRGSFWKVDPSTNRPVAEQIVIGDEPPVIASDVVTGFGSVWVASGDGKIWRFVP